MVFSEGIATPLVAAAFGYAGGVANVAWPLMKSRRLLLAGQALACACMFVHLTLLSAYTGALIMLVAGMQAILAIPLENASQSKKMYLGSLLLMPIVCYLSWQGMQSVFSSIALAIVCMANFQLDPVLQRRFLIAAVFAWLAHSLIIGSAPGVVSNALALATSGYMLITICSSAARFEDDASQPAASP